MAPRKDKEDVQEDELAAEDIYDEDDDGDFQDDEEENSGRTSSKNKLNPKKRGVSAFIDEAAEEDDDEEEMESRKKKRSIFIDDEVDVTSDEEDEETEEDVEGLIDDDAADVEAPLPVSRYHRLHREQDLSSGEKNDEDFYNHLVERYGHSRDMDSAGVDYSDLSDLLSGARDAVTQQGLLPTSNDPKLFLVYVRPGCERELVVQLLQKSYVLASRDEPAKLFSACALDNVKGFIYVEAAKESHVRDAVSGLRNVFFSKEIKVVPVNEMADVLTVRKVSSTTLSRGTWVRYRSGLYKDDLAQVVSVDPASRRVLVRHLHRLDFVQMANPEPLVDEKGKRRNPFGRRPGEVRPPPKVFSRQEARNANLIVDNHGTNEEGYPLSALKSHRFVAGWIEREVSHKMITEISGIPPVDEMKRFQGGASAGQAQGGRQTSGGAGSGLDPAADLDALISNLPGGGGGGGGGYGGVETSVVRFIKGDNVAVTSGDLISAEGVVEGVKDIGTANARVTVRLKIEGFDDLIDMTPSELVKVFKTGQRVRVISGARRGEIGVVDHLENDSYSIIADMSHEVFTVFSRDLTDASDNTNATIVLSGQFQLHDFVQLDAQEAGVIVKLERDAAVVLVASTPVPDRPLLRTVRGSEIQKRIQQARDGPGAKGSRGGGGGMRRGGIVTVDAFKNEIRENDLVTILNGPLSGKSGNVDFIWQKSLFLRGRELPMDHGGIVCCQGTHVRVNGKPMGNANMNLAADILRGTPNSFARAQNFVPPSPGNAFSSMMSPPLAGGGGGGGGFGGGGGRSMVGQNVRVLKGPYTGYRGLVKNQTATHVQLELEAVAQRAVTVPIDVVQPIAPVVNGGGGAKPLGMGIGMGMGMGIGGGGGMGGRGIGSASGGRGGGEGSEDRYKGSGYSGSTYRGSSYAAGRDSFSHSNSSNSNDYNSYSNRSISAPPSMRAGGGAFVDRRNGPVPPQTPMHPYGMYTPAHVPQYMGDVPYTPAHVPYTPAVLPYIPSHTPYTPSNASYTSGSMANEQEADPYGSAMMTAATPGMGGAYGLDVMTPALTPASGHDDIHRLDKDHSE